MTDNFFYAQTEQQSRFENQRVCADSASAWYGDLASCAANLESQNGGAYSTGMQGPNLVLAAQRAAGGTTPPGIDQILRPILVWVRRPEQLHRWQAVV